jgi:hypothetical protein
VESYQQGEDTLDEMLERKKKKKSSITFFNGSESRGTSEEVSVMEMEQQPQVVCIKQFNSIITRILV